MMKVKVGAKKRPARRRKNRHTTHIRIPLGPKVEVPPDLVRQPPPVSVLGALLRERFERHRAFVQHRDARLGFVVRNHAVAGALHAAVVVKVRLGGCAGGAAKLQTKKRRNNQM